MKSLQPSPICSALLRQPRGLVPVRRFEMPWPYSWAITPESRSLSRFTGMSAGSMLSSVTFRPAAFAFSVSPSALKIITDGMLTATGAAHGERAAERVVDDDHRGCARGVGLLRLHGEGAGPAVDERDRAGREIALVDRGTCNFTVKAQNADAAGAVRIDRRQQHARQPRSPMAGAVAVDIPSVMISADGGTR